MVNFGVEGIQPKGESNSDKIRYVLTEIVSFSVTNLPSSHVIFCENSRTNHAIFERLHCGRNLKTTKIAPQCNHEKITLS
jgi:hypothetical protein